MEKTRFALLQFDLAYLALLTQDGMKPLSRWEGVVPNGIDAVMDEMDLEFAHVYRRLQDGRSATEFIFSKLETHLDLYLQRFENSPIDKSSDTQRLEGFLFGFPPCRVESFARCGHRSNGLPMEDQKLLLQWHTRTVASIRSTLPGSWCSHTLRIRYRIKSNDSHAFKNSLRLLCVLRGFAVPGLQANVYKLTIVR